MPKAVSDYSQSAFQSQASAGVGAVFGPGPLVPASGQALLNPFGVPQAVVITGGTMSNVSVSGTTVGVGAGTYKLGPVDTITMTYSAAPTWSWSGIPVAATAAKHSDGSAVSKTPVPGR